MASTGYINPDGMYGARWQFKQASRIRSGNLVVGFDAAGIGFPGHFLSVIRGEQDTLIDAFEGKIVTREDCEVLLRRTLGKQAIFEAEMLRASTAREILLRILNNLKQIYFQKSEWKSALAC